MLRIIRIVVSLIAFFVITGFVAASDSGDAGGSARGSDTTVKLRMGQFPERARGMWR